MSTYLYRYPLGQPDSNSAFVGELLGGDKVYMLPHATDSTLVGEWDNNGELVSMDAAVYDELRPFGNLEGNATDSLDMIHYQGHSQRHMQDIPAVDTLPEYPADNQPFTLRITRTKILDDGFPHIPWGWIVEMLSADPVRTITARGIGVYTEADTYLYTTGSFVLTDFDELNDEGEPVVVQRYATVCPVGQRKADPGPVYFKLLLGAAPEGAWQLTDLDEGAIQTRLFWGANQ